MEDLERAFTGGTKGQVGRMLDLFSQAPVDITLDRYFEEIILPDSPLTRQTRQISFKSLPTNAFTDISQSRLEITVKLIMPGGGNIPQQQPPDHAAANPGAGFINNVLSSMFKELDLRISNTSVSPMTALYPFTAYFVNLLGFQEDAVETKLSQRGWVKEQDSDNFDAFGTDGFANLAKFTQASHEWTLSGPIHHGLTHQPRLLIPMLPISVNLTLSDAAFAIKSGVANANQEFEITNAQLIMKRVVVNPSIQAGIESRLLRSPCLYPIKHIRTKSYLINNNLSSFTVADVFAGSFVPRSVHLALVPQANVVGSRITSPFKFAHNSVRDMYFQIGALRCPSIPWDVNYAADPQQFVRVYNALFAGTGQNSDDGIQFKQSLFASNFNIWTFDFSQDDTPESFRPKQISSVLFHVSFVRPVPATLQLIIFQTSEEVLSIDSSRNVMVNFPL